MLGGEMLGTDEIRRAIFYSSIESAFHFGSVGSIFAVATFT